jgi:hypothetical protein
MTDTGGRVSDRRQEDGTEEHLRSRAKELGPTGYSRTRTSELISMLRDD